MLSNELLDRAAKVFFFASDLGEKFRDRHFGRLADDGLAKIVDELLAAVVALKDEILRPPHGFEGIAQDLESTRKTTQDLLRVAPSPYHEVDLAGFAVDFRTLGLRGLNAVKALRPRPVDLLEFGCEQPSAVHDAGPPRKSSNDEILDDVVLRPREIGVLLVLHERHAFDSDHLMTAAQIGPLIDPKYRDGQSVKVAISRLGKLQLVKSQVGRGGGSWLTPTGCARAEKL